MIMHKNIQYENIIYRLNEFEGIPCTPKFFTEKTKPAYG